MLALHDNRNTVSITLPMLTKNIEFEALLTDQLFGFRICTSVQIESVILLAKQGVQSGLQQELSKGLTLVPYPARRNQQRNLVVHPVRTDSH
jgi:hypothetical protein